MKEHSVSLFPFTISVLFFVCHGQAVRQYDVLLKEILRCRESGTDEVRFTSTKLTKVSRHTFSYLSNLTLAITLDDNISAVSDVEAWGNGGWRPSYFTQDTPHFCSGCKKLNPKWFHELIKNTGHDDCPIPPGIYEINAYNISFIEFTFPLAASGKFRMINSIFKQDVLVGCIGMVLDVSPKRSHSKKRHDLE
ncbi:unnamed protein product [Nezara viridula]|uniref:MD-2-related lipid-recognition domain-containing protein n=1 Tax=Nezara viridula TaxID=85310 RepID=A0A9P0MN61_NEZVI|nr:unnamed protein product [Nezara viridula]